MKYIRPLNEALMATSLDTYKMADSFTPSELKRYKADGKISDEVYNGAIEIQRSWKQSHPTMRIGGGAYKKEMLKQLNEDKLNEASLNSTQKAAAEMNKEVRVIKKAMKNIQKISKDIKPKDNNAWGNYILRGINSLLDNFTILETVYQNLISNKEDDAIDSIKRFEDRTK